MYFPTFSTLGKVAQSLAWVILAFLILTLSLVKAGWEMAVEKRLGDELREVSVNTEIVVDGNSRKSCYRFPESRVLPGSLTYQMKLWRDQLWWHYAPPGLAKAKTANLIADKRMMEAVRLVEEDVDNELVWETSYRAVEWLNRARSYIQKVDENQAEKEFWEDRLDEAGITYRGLLVSFSKKCSNGVQYMELTKKLNYPNEETYQKPAKIIVGETI